MRDVLELRKRGRALILSPNNFHRSFVLLHSRSRRFFFCHEKTTETPLLLKKNIDALVFRLQISVVVYRCHESGGAVECTRSPWKQFRAGRSVCNKQHQHILQTIYVENPHYKAFCEY